MKNGQADVSGSSTRAPVQCPQCSSYNNLRCWHESTERPLSLYGLRSVYNYRMREITNGAEDESADQDEEEQDFTSRSRKTKADSRVQIQPAPVPKLGFNTLLLDQAIAAGPGGIRKAQHVALKFGKKYHEEAINHFRKVTAFLQHWIDKGDSHYRACARVSPSCCAPDF